MVEIGLDEVLYRDERVQGTCGLLTMGAHAIVLKSRCGLLTLVAGSRGSVLYVQYCGVWNIGGILLRLRCIWARAGLHLVERRSRSVVTIHPMDWWIFWVFLQVSGALSVFAFQHTLYDMILFISGIQLCILEYNRVCSVEIRLIGFNGLFVTSCIQPCKR